MGEFDAFAGDYSDVDALIPGLKPDVEKEARGGRWRGEKKAVQAQWRAKDADVRDVRAEYVKWMRANGKKAPARAARKKHPDASQDAKPLSGNALAEAAQDKKKAQGEFERWKKENRARPETAAARRRLELLGELASAWSRAHPPSAAVATRELGFGVGRERRRRSSPGGPGGGCRG